MSTDIKRSFCRICHAACPIDVHVEHGRPVKITGVDDDPIFRGYTCVKGRRLPDQFADPARLTSPLRRSPSGTFEPVTSQEALDEIADRLARIIAEHGPRSVATYTGTGGYQNAPSHPVAAAFHRAIGSVSYYTSVTIDQPTKATTAMRMGMWEAGPDNFADAGVLLAVGYNPMVSSFAPFGGLQGTDPFATLRRRRAEGMRLVVVDPRRTELAAQADLHLQVRPGEDPTLLAGLLHVILGEGLYDRDFCDRWVADGHVDALAAAVQPFTPAFVAAKCDVPADDVVAAARMFAEGGRGVAGTGTGPSMAPRPTLTEHLTQCLNVVCNRFMREGETVHAGGFLQPPSRTRAQVVGPFGDPRGPESRFRGLRGYNGEMPCTALAQEITTPGDGQVRALIVNGGNPVAAWPDQVRTLEAMEALDLLVVIDHRMSQTAEFADYVLAPRLSLERADVPPFMDRWFREPYACYTPAVLDPVGDQLNDWEVYWEIAERLGVTIELAGGPIPSGVRPSDDEVLDLIYAKARVPLDVVRANSGSVLWEYAVTVAPADTDAPGRFHIALDDILTELGDVRRETTSAEIVQGFDPEVHRFRLVSRRLKGHLNSLGAEVPGTHRAASTNYAYMHPDDLADLGVDDEGLVRISSPRASLVGVAKAAPDVRRGVVSMAHGWGDTSGSDDKVRDVGAPTNRLIDVDNGYCRITGQAIQSSIPVAVEAVVLEGAAAS